MATGLTTSGSDATSFDGQLLVREAEGGAFLRRGLRTDGRFRGQNAGREQECRGENYYTRKEMSQAVTFLFRQHLEHGHDFIGQEFSGSGTHAQAGARGGVRFGRVGGRARQHPHSERQKDRANPTRPATTRPGEEI